MNESFLLLLLAGGKGDRFRESGGKGLKQFASIGGETVLHKAASPFFSLQGFAGCVVAYPQGMENEARKAMGDLSGERTFYVEGGRTRTESAKKCVLFSSSLPFSFSLILIHDAARPFTSPSLIRSVLRDAEEYGAAAPVVFMSDALKRIATNGEMTESLDRREIGRIQTPQAFRAKELQEAYGTAFDNEEWDDDIAFWMSRGKKAKATKGEEENRKITFLSDVGREEDGVKMRIGIGSDVHRLVPGRKLVVGGVRFDAPKGEEAHSDGDVLIHAAIDALLGATAKGDIGRLFPVEDDRWKDADSAAMLSSVISSLRPHIINFDSVVTLEGFLLSPHIEEIRRSMASLLGIPLSSVSVKAKTNEGMGELGQGEAIKAEAVALIAE